MFLLTYIRAFTKMHIYEYIQCIYEYTIYMKDIHKSLITHTRIKSTREQKNVHTFAEISILCLSSVVLSPSPAPEPSRRSPELRASVAS